MSANENGLFAVIRLSLVYFYRSIFKNMFVVVDCSRGREGRSSLLCLHLSKIYITLTPLQFFLERCGSGRGVM